MASGLPGVGSDSVIAADQRLCFLAIRPLGSTRSFGSGSGSGIGLGASFSMIARTGRRAGDIGQGSSANFCRA
jgi:hypothetical protein